MELWRNKPERVVGWPQTDQWPGYFVHSLAWGRCQPLNVKQLSGKQFIELTTAVIISFPPMLTLPTHSTGCDGPGRLD